MQSVFLAMMLALGSASSAQTEERLKAYELDSMLTLVWKRTGERWRIIHEHVSVRLPPPTSK